MKRINWLRIMVTVNFLVTIWLVFAVIDLAKLLAALGVSLDFFAQVLGKVLKYT